MRIAVLGGGNGSMAAAADLAEQGHDIRWWRRDAAALGPVIAAGGITLKDHCGARLVPLGLATGDLGAALDGAALVVAPIPAPGQVELARAMAPHLNADQVVLLPPGSFGSVVMGRMPGGARAVFAESGTLPYLARKHGPGAIAITTRATRLPTGVFPADGAEAAMAVIRGAYPAAEACGDGLSGALMNAGPIIHPPLILMNAGPIEHFPHWDIHNEGTQPAIRRVTTALDAERIAVREALGYGPPHFPLADHYGERPDGEEWMYGNLGHEKLVDSGDWRERLELTAHRYMTEDVAYGLAFLVSVGGWAGVATPVASGLLALGGAVCGTDFLNGPRTLGALGLAGLSRDAMAALLRTGEGA